MQGLPAAGQRKPGKPRPVTTERSAPFPQAPLGPPVPDLCGLPGNPRGPRSAHEFRAHEERRGAGRPGLGSCAHLRPRRGAGCAPQLGAGALRPPRARRGHWLRGGATPARGSPRVCCGHRPPRGRLPGWGEATPPPAEPRARRRVKPGMGGGPFVPAARRPARLIGGRLRAQPANLARPLRALPGRRSGPEGLSATAARKCSR